MQGSAIGTLGFRACCKLPPVNLEVRICACGAECDQEASRCARCGAVLSASSGKNESPRVDTKANSANGAADSADADANSANGAASGTNPEAPEAAAQAARVEGVDPETPGPSVQAPRAVDENTTVPMMAPTTATDSGRGYDLGSVFGSYRLVKQIGAGGMGHVFIAEHTRLGRQVALKILRTEYSGNIEAVKRFFAEAQAVNRINHENIIEVSDFIENPQGPSFYIMELLKGMDLRTMEDTAGVLPLPRTLAIATQVCKGLAAAHEAGIVHRDLKPDNIFLVNRGGRTDFVKLLDFGIAKLMNAALEGPSTFKSMAGIVVGTPEYMAPEQAMGQQVDHRADIYSVGVILFELVTGRRPFAAESAREIMVKHLMVAPPRPNRFRTFSDALPPGLEELILGCLKKEPRDRPQSMKEVEQRLVEILNDLPEAGRPKGFQQYLRDKRLWLAAGGFVVLTGSVAAGLILSKNQRNVATAALAADVAQKHQGKAPPPANKDGTKQQVRISFVSTPPGAAVFRAGTEQPLGVTPFSASFDVSTRAEVYEFRLEGWQVGREAITLLENAQVEVSLVAADRDPVGEALHKRRGTGKREHAKASDPAKPGTDQSKAVKLDSDAVLNPFE